MINFNKPTRVWVNQPSTLQPLHKFHGKTGIALTDKNGFTTLYFEKGPVISTRIDKSCLEVVNSQSDVFEIKDNPVPSMDDYTPPFRVGRKQRRAVLDSNGIEVALFSTGSEKIAQAFCNYLNGVETSKTQPNKDYNERGKYIGPNCEYRGGDCKCSLAELGHYCE